MIAFLGYRLVAAIPVLLGTTLLIHLLVFALPGDPVAALFGDSVPTDQQREVLRERYGLDEPFVVHYLGSLLALVSGDLGRSYSGEPIAALVARTLPVTLRLAALVLLMELVVGIAVGVVCGLRRGSLFDTGVLAATVVFLSLPVFVVAFVAQYVFGVWLGWVRPTVGPGAPWAELVLPAAVLACVYSARIVRLTRSSVIETAGLDFVRTARAHGLSGRRVLVRIVRSSLAPAVTALATDFGALLAGATVTEGVFNVPGTGNELYRAIVRGEGATIVALVTVVVLLILAVSLIGDVVNAALDPRVRIDPRNRMGPRGGRPSRTRAAQGVGDAP